MRIRTLIIASSFLLLSAGQISFAESLANEAVTVSVRTVKAAKNTQSGDSLDLDSRLEDLRGKLKGLGFGSFRLVSTDSRKVVIEHREIIALGNGTTLTVRPLYAKGSRVGMWLKWQDPSGDNLLDTRMHFAQGESMIAGADQTGDTGILLAIDVNPAN